VDALIQVDIELQQHVFQYSQLMKLLQIFAAVIHQHYLN
jgi:hypothetical protein